MLRSDGSAGPMPVGRRLVLLDLNLPRVGGLSFLRELRSDPHLRHTPVIVLITSDGDRDKLEASGLDVAGYIVKPVTMDAFVQVVESLYQFCDDDELP